MEQRTSCHRSQVRADSHVSKLGADALVAVVPVSAALLRLGECQVFGHLLTVRVLIESSGARRFLVWAKRPNGSWIDVLARATTGRHVRPGDLTGPNRYARWMAQGFEIELGIYLA